MGKYTELLEYEGKEIYPEDDNYTEELIRFAKRFRFFDEALTEYILQHDYNGDANDTEGKIAYLKSKFENAGISAPRNLKKWFTEHKRLERRTAFQICFALELDLAETEDFFRRVVLERGFDCHYMEEAVYYFAIKNSLKYSDAAAVLEQIPASGKENIDFGKQVYYTSSIVEEIDRFTKPEELLSFFNGNIHQFVYNNATAYKYIHEIWEKIAALDGLAIKEKRELLPSNEEEDADEKKLSIWDVYLQILGFEESELKLLDADRSIKPILKDNILLHPIAQESFPDREGIQNILAGKHVSYERVRKIIILLVFYKYWVTLALKRKDGTYRAKGGEADRCLSEINKYLLDAGYPELYFGNPYDWVFMYAMQDDFPLLTFREFMNELFVVREDEISHSAFDIRAEYAITD